MTIFFLSAMPKALHLAAGVKALDRQTGATTALAPVSWLCQKHTTTPRALLDEGPFVQIPENWQVVSRRMPTFHSSMIGMMTTTRVL